MCMLHTLNTCARTSGGQAAGRAHAYACTYVNTPPLRAPAWVSASANIVKLDNSDCLRKLIRCNAGPLTVHFFEERRTRG